MIQYCFEDVKDLKYERFKINNVFIWSLLLWSSSQRKLRIYSINLDKDIQYFFVYFTALQVVIVESGHH